MTWPLETAARCIGRDVYVNDWAVEKLCKVAEDMAAITEGLWSHDSGWARPLDAYRNTAKLAAWMAGNLAQYDDAGAEEAIDGGIVTVRHHMEQLLAPILRDGRSGKVK